MTALSNLRAYIGKAFCNSKVSELRAMFALCNDALDLIKHRKLFFKKERGQSPARKIVSTLFPRRLRFVFA